MKNEVSYILSRPTILKTLIKFTDAMGKFFTTEERQRIALPTLNEKFNGGGAYDESAQICARKIDNCQTDGSSVSTTGAIDLVAEIKNAEGHSGTATPKGVSYTAHGHKQALAVDTNQRLY